MRSKLFVANWKMHKNIKEARNFILGFKSIVQTLPVEVVICPTNICLDEVANLIDHRRIKLGAQNVFYESSGAFTGEVSPEMLAHCKCQFVIVGHSERRTLFGEQTSVLAKKVQACIAHQLTPIFCVGESLEHREKNIHLEYVKEQLHGLFSAVNTQLNHQNIVFAYEPIWAIGTGKTASPGDAQEMHRFIRAELISFLGEEEAKKISILYGGSVKPNNSKVLMQEADIDGVLVGGASLDVSAFADLIKEALSH